MILEGLLILSFTGGVGNSLHGSEQIVPLANLKTCHSYRDAYIAAKVDAYRIRKIGEDTIRFEVNTGTLAVNDKYTLTCTTAK